jgi:hypothetical protein
MILSRLRSFWARLSSAERSHVRRPVRDVRPSDSLEKLEIRKLPSVSVLGTTTGLGGAHSVQQQPSGGSTVSHSKNQHDQNINNENGTNPTGPGHIIAMYGGSGGTTSVVGGSGNATVVGGGGNSII